MQDEEFLGICEFKLRRVKRGLVLVVWRLGTSIESKVPFALQMVRKTKVALGS